MLSDVCVQRAGRTSDHCQRRSHGGRRSRTDVAQECTKGGGAVKEHDRSVSEGLTSFEDRFPVEDRPSDFLPSANVRGEEKQSHPGATNTNGGVQHGPLYKLAQSGVPGTRDSKQCTGGSERVSSPPEAVMRTSVVAGLMACYDELGLPRRSRV